MAGLGWCGCRWKDCQWRVRLAVVVLGSAVWLSLTAGAAKAGETAFSAPGNYVFTVPADVDSISMTAIGAVGGACGALRGGLGASVTASAAVFPGQQLFVGVASPGAACRSAGGGGGLGGGGSGGYQNRSSGPGGAGGGGASLVSMFGVGFPGFGDGALVVGAGGGGAAAGTCGPGGSAGSAGGGGGSVPAGGGGGSAGTASGPGDGGAGPTSPVAMNVFPGEPGSFSVGGAGGAGNFPGGGGGGGVWGGGGGGAGDAGACGGGGGGGGGSFLAANVTGVIGPAPTGLPSQVKISYSGRSTVGSALQSELMTCRSERVTVRRHGHSELVAGRRCTGRLVVGAKGVTLHGAQSAATLSRGQVSYARGVSVSTGHGESKLLFHVAHALRPGRYTLRLRTRHGHGWVSRQLPVIIR
jgi:hypothetical protein